MNYHSKTTDPNGNLAPTGEICVKGLNITPGYFRDKKNTESTIDKDGWLHTGDVGRIMHEDKGLKVIDRVKEIFKLAQGEYIAPSKLEGSYGMSPYVDQICIHGDSHHTFVIAIICPNKPKCKEFLVSKGKLKDNCDLNAVDDFMNDKDLHEEVKKSLDALAKEKNFNSLERVPKMILCKEPFTLQNNLLTDTLKIKRRAFDLTFAKEIESIYSKETK